VQVRFLVRTEHYALIELSLLLAACHALEQVVPVGQPDREISLIYPDKIRLNKPDELLINDGRPVDADKKLAWQ
jgi:hypothetical protein